MIWPVECLWALLRALAVAALALGAGALLCPLLRAARPRVRAAAWILLPVPWLTPVAVVGYFYFNCSLALVRHPALNALLYHILLAMRLAPLAALVMFFAPRWTSDAAVHCHRLLAGRDGLLRHWLFRLRAAARPAAVAFCLAFLLAFTEFELATLMTVRTWTVRLFDAQTIFGAPIGETLRLVALPAAIEAIVLMGGYLLLAGGRGAPEARPRPAKGRALPLLGAAWLVLSLAVVTVIPFSALAKDSTKGLPALLDNFVIGRELLTSVCIGAATAALAWAAGGAARRGLRSADCGLRNAGPARAWNVLLKSAIRNPQSAFVPWLLSLPGLLGALVLSLLLVGLFQLPVLRIFWRPEESLGSLGEWLTLLPLLLGLVLLLLPFALIMRRLFRAHSAGQGLHAAEMLKAAGEKPLRSRGARLARFIRARGRFWALCLLFSLAYFDLTVSSILAPPGTGTVSARLYNLMHYGRTQALSGMVLATFALLALLLAVAAAVRSLYERLNGNV